MKTADECNDLARASRRVADFLRHDHSAAAQLIMGRMLKEADKYEALARRRGRRAQRLAERAAHAR